MFKDIMSTLRAIILPHTCYLCQNVTGSDGFCTSCFADISFITGKRCQCCWSANSKELSNSKCPVCIKRRTCIKRFRAIIKYNTIAKNIVIAYKNKYNMRLHQWVCNMLINKMHEFDSIDMIIPVPTHWIRHITRGYCHTYLIARDTASMAKVPYRPDILFKSFMTRSQAGLNKADRSNNLSESFNVCDTAIQSICGASILLIDDVRTTGSTLEECANTLIKCGAKHVYGLALAMT